MATEIVTAKAGTNHVDSEDIGALYAGGFGKGRYALDLGNGLKCSMRDANTLVIDTGGIMFDGRFVRVKSAESLTVTNGTQSQHRKDLAVLTYKRDASNNNIETVSWSVLRGTPASSESAAKVPTFTEGSILDGDATAVVAVAEVDLAGLTPTCKLLLPTVTSLATLGESVSQVSSALGGARLFVGSTVRTVPATADSVRVWTGSEFKSSFGEDFSASSDVVVFMNGDAYANDVHVDGSQHYHGDIYANLNKTRASAATIRLNYIVALGD